MKNYIKILVRKFTTSAHNYFRHQRLAHLPIMSTEQIDAYNEEVREGRPEANAIVMSCAFDGNISYQLLFHPKTKDHLAILDGVAFRVYHPGDEPTFIGLNLLSLKIARELYEEVHVDDLDEYKCILSGGDGVGFMLNTI